MRQPDPIHNFAQLEGLRTAYADPRVQNIIDNLAMRIHALNKLMLKLDEMDSRLGGMPIASNEASNLAAEMYSFIRRLRDLAGNVSVPRMDEVERAYCNYPVETLQKEYPLFGGRLHWDANTGAVYFIKVNGVETQLDRKQAEAIYINLDAALKEG